MVFIVSKTCNMLRGKIFPHLHFLTSWFGNHTNWIYILVIRGRIILLRQLIWFKCCMQKFPLRGLKTCFILRPFSLFILFFLTFWRNWHDYCQAPLVLMQKYSKFLISYQSILYLNAFYAYNIIPNTRNLKHHSNGKSWTMKNHRLLNLPPFIHIISLFMESTVQKSMFTCLFNNMLNLLQICYIITLKQLWHFWHYGCLGFLFSLIPCS